MASFTLSMSSSLGILQRQLNFYRIHDTSWYFASERGFVYNWYIVLGTFVGGAGEAT